MDRGDRVRQIFREHQDAEERFSDTHQRMGEEMRFFGDLEQYIDEAGNTRVATRIQPRDQGPFRLVRYKAGIMWKKAPLYFDAQPVEPSDNQAAEFGSRVLEFDVTAKRKRYKQLRYMAWVSGFGARQGVIWIDYDATRKDIIPSLGDPRNIVWADGFLHPQDPLCPWVDKKARIPVSQAKRMYPKFAKDFRPDPGEPTQSTQDGDLMPGEVRFDSLGRIGDEAGQDEGLVTIIHRWERFSPDTTMLEAEYVELPDEQRYMKCSTCGFETPPQAEFIENLPEKTEPENGLVCPKCGGDMERQDALKVMEERRKFPGGRRYTCIAPYCIRDEPLYDGKWPNRTNNSENADLFPVIVFQPYPLPHRRIGQSDTALNWTMSLAKNALIRIAYEHMLRAKPYWKIPATGLEDVNGYPFTFADENSDIMVYTSDFPPDGIDVVQGQGLSSAWTAVYDRMGAELMKNEGTSDVQIAPGETKDIPVGTLEQLTETGNVPLDTHVGMWFEEESLGMQVWFDMIRATWDAEKYIRWRGYEGIKYLEVLGAAMPDMDIRIFAGPSQTIMDRERGEAFMMLLNIPAPFREGFAKHQGIDPEVLRDVQAADPDMQLLAQVKASMQAQQQGAQNQMTNGGGPQMSPQMQGV